MGGDSGSVSRPSAEMSRSGRSVSTTGVNGFAKAGREAFNKGMKITGSSGLFPSLADLRVFGRALKERLEDFSPSFSFRLLPKTKAEWERLILFPFKTYVLLAIPGVMLVASSSRHVRANVDLQSIGFGYFLCFLVLLYGAVRQWTQGLLGQSIVTFIFTALALLGAIVFQGP